MQTNAPTLTAAHQANIPDWVSDGYFDGEWTARMTRGVSRVSETGSDPLYFYRGTEIVYWETDTYNPWHLRSTLGRGFPSMTRAREAIDAERAA